MTLRKVRFVEPVFIEPAIIEPMLVFGLIVAYIWKLRFDHPWSWTAALAVVILSHVIRGERPAALGFRLQHLGDCLKRFGPLLISIAVALAGLGIVLGTVRPMTLGQAALALGLYLPWGLFQQYLMNAYFLRRFEAVISPRAAGLLTAALFAAVHSPNWFLMLVTPVGGYIAIQVHRRYSNLFFLGMAHATIGFLLFLTVPDSVSHHLNVGPSRAHVMARNLPSPGSSPAHADVLVIDSVNHPSDN